LSVRALLICCLPPWYHQLACNYEVRNIVRSNCHPAVFTSNVQCVCLAAELRIEAGDATEALTNGAINETLRFFSVVAF